MGTRVAALYFKKTPLGNSLVVQWLGFDSLTALAQVQSLGWEDPLKEGMVTHSRILA